MRDASGTFHILPGGGQRHGETLQEGLRRECREELGVDIKVGKLFYVREYIGKNHRFSKYHRHFHQLEVVFECGIEGEPETFMGSERDRKQVGVVWIPVQELDPLRFLPKALIPLISGELSPAVDRYQGDVN